MIDQVDARVLQWIVNVLGVSAEAVQFEVPDLGTALDLIINLFLMQITPVPRAHDLVRGFSPACWL